MKKARQDVLIVGIGIVFLLGILLLMFLPKSVYRRVDENPDNFSTVNGQKLLIIEDDLDEQVGKTPEGQAEREDMRQRTRDMQRRVDLTDIVLALELYFQDNNEYPSSLEGGLSDYFDSGVIPSDPFGGSYHYELCGELGGKAYGYALAAEVENPKSDEYYFVGDLGNGLLDPTTCELTVAEAELDNPGNLYLIYRK